MAHDPFVLDQNLLAKRLKSLSSGPKISGSLRSVTLHPSPGAHDPLVLGKNLLAKWLKYLSSGPKISAGLRMVASGYSSLTAFSPAACWVELRHIM